MSASSMNKQNNMNGMTIYAARNRDMLLAIKLVNTLEPTMQRPLSKTA